MQRNVDFPSNFIFFTIFVGFVVLFGLTVATGCLAFLFQFETSWEIIAVLLYSGMISMLLASLVYAIFLKNYDQKRKLKFLKSLQPFFVILAILFLAVLGRKIFDMF